MTRIPLFVVVLVLLAASSGGHVVWGDYLPGGTLGETEYVVWGN